MPEQLDIGIFCDRFLHTKYGYQIAEFNATLEHFSRSYVYTYCRDLWAPYDSKYFKKDLAAYERDYPHLKGRAKQLYPRLNNSDPRLATHAILSVKNGEWKKPRHGYCILAMNAFLFLPLWEYLQIPFSFTLYPGGGFRMAPGLCQKTMGRIFKSPMFRSVTINMKNTLAYVKENFDVPDEKILYVYGGTVAVDYYQKHMPPKKRYPADKKTIDICFVANRYTELGIDKGYDRFIGMAHLLHAQNKELHFHIVGNFNPNIMNVSALGKHVHFYGSRPTKWLAEFFSGMDIFFSASVPHMISRGEFDGFPTTSAVESSICGVAVATSDPLNLNEVYRDDRDIIFIDGNPDAMAAKMIPYLLFPERLYKLAEAGQKTSLKYFSAEAQMKPRLARFERLLAKG